MIQQDDEFLAPSRSVLAYLNAEITRQEELAVSDIDRYGYGDPEYARQRWAEFNMTVAPLRREQDGIGKIMADYYGTQAAPPQIVIPGQ